jgi:hypothetical protein
LSNVVIRPLRAGEEQLFLSMNDPAPLGDDPEYNPEIYAPQRSWVALRHDEVVARAAWAVKPGTHDVMGLDWFDLVDAEAGAELLEIAQANLRDRYGRVPEYHLYLKPGWRDRPAEVEAVERRLAAARRSGLEVAGERVRHVWTAVNPLPSAPGRFAISAAESIAGYPAPEVLTGVELAFADAVNLAENPFHGMRDAQILEAEGAGVAIIGVHGPVGWIARLALREEAARLDLLIEATARLAADGIPEIYADAEKAPPALREALAEIGYRPIRNRLFLRPVTSAV